MLPDLCLTLCCLFPTPTEPLPYAVTSSQDQGDNSQQDGDNSQQDGDNSQQDGDNSQQDGDVDGTQPQDVPPDNMPELQDPEPGAVPVLGGCHA